MTRQDGYTGKVGSGFKGNIPRRDYEYPPERLTEFLKLDIDNKEEFNKFRNNYQLIILPTEEVISAVKDEQEKLKNISIKLFSKEILTKSETKLINSRLGKIRFTVSYPASKDKMSNALPSLRSQLRENYLSFGKTYSSIFAPFWEELINHFLIKQDIKNCINCGNFFTSMSRHKKNYCSDECGSALRQARHRAKINKKK